MAAPKQAARKPRRRDRKSIPVGQAHIKSTFNNTIISITDPSGAVVSWASGGDVGFKGSRKSTPYAAGMAAESAARKAMEHGVKKVDVFVKGRVPVVRPLSVLSSPLDSKSVPSPTSLRKRTTAFVPRSVVASEHSAISSIQNRLRKVSAPPSRS